MNIAFHEEPTLLLFLILINLKVEKNICTDHIYLIYSYILHFKWKRKSWSIIYGCPTIDQKYWRVFSLFLNSSLVYLPMGTLVSKPNDLQSNAQLSNLLKLLQWNLKCSCIGNQQSLSNVLPISVGHGNNMNLKLFAIFK